MANLIEQCHGKNAVASGKRHGVRPSDILAVLEQEGGTGAGCKPRPPGDGAGPPSFGQFTHATGRSLGIQYGNSQSEVDGVARYLIQNGYKKDRTRSIAAYNGGPGNPQYDYAALVIGRSLKYKKYDGSDPGTWIGDTMQDHIQNEANDPESPGAGFEQITDDNPLDAIKGALDKITSGQTWKNVAFVVGGGVALSIGVLILAGEFMQKIPTPVSAVAKGALKAK